MIRRLFARISYRLWQFKQGLLPQLDLRQWQQALVGLPEQLRQQLLILKKSEKAHVLRVYMAIRAETDLPEPLRNELLQLALLHDIGKSIARHGLLFKVLKVIFPVANTQHCVAGALFLKRNKVARVMVRRVLRHHDKNTMDDILRLFQKFDDRL